MPRRVRKRRTEKKSGAAAGTTQRWKYLAVLSFLKPFITPRETTSNMQRGFEKDQAAGYNHPEEPEEAAAGLLETRETAETVHDTDMPDPDVPEPAAASSVLAGPSSPVQAGPSPAAAQTGPPKKKVRRRQQDSWEPTEFEREMLEALKNRAPTPAPCSEDEHFLLSLLPLMQKVPPQSKDFVKFQIHKLLYENSTAMLNLEPLEPSQ
ncbi:hypothetical protein ATANTOWER_028753 [Ataeniobius toweri]|uniref:BESS domain-containing protein n=1 Tax=Ataeniobius toweri TaxID=208326 RepID=A0ABU7BAP7_9TELE|nr:hypothetical protein [Ataeniobius toweri]